MGLMELLAAYGMTDLIDNHKGGYGGREWAVLMRKLDRPDPRFRS